MNSPIDFDRWVSDNNPPPHLEYGRGWWDYIEIIRRLAAKFSIEQVDVVSTYLMKTPTPEEELLMPVMRMSDGQTGLTIKYDFGRYPESWTVSVVCVGAGVELPAAFVSVMAAVVTRPVAGFRNEWIYGSYQENPAQFTCELADELDLACLLRLVVVEGLAQGEK